ncbi:MAG: hypothetical protein FJ109_07830, partial [Deltaproteobacteria bacterium]|nr:hypothetical protein [Deltaproteobacteria bacterium]
MGTAMKVNLPCGCEGVRGAAGVGLVSAAALLVACSSGGSVVTGPDVPEVVTDAAAEVAAEVAVELPGLPEVTPDVQLPEEAFDFGGPQCRPGEGCFLDPCADNKDCQSGWCVEHMGDGVCTQLCTEECPSGWKCQQIAGAAPDLVYACVSVHANLCRPCEDGGDCKSAGGLEDVCVRYGAEGSFCGGACEATQECPWGFSCKKVASVDGVETMQCVADTGVCPCTDKSVALGLWTPCESASEWGTCGGKRVCGEAGLSVCDAPVPAPETCNGNDDDCDGEVDEPNLVEGKYLELCDDSNACTNDFCKAAAGCDHDLLDEGECVDGDACTVGDHCEAGQCIGLPVACDDGNECTDDVCDGKGGCSATFNTASCDDDDPCTVADQCAQGVCKGVAVSCDCQESSDCAALEDGDVCNGTLFCDKGKLPYLCAVKPGTTITCPPPQGVDAICLEATCDLATGACGTAPDHEGFACDDGDPCTVGGACKAGDCLPGVAMSCNDGNPCTDDSCKPAVGCVSTPNSLACNDGDACTTGDKCLGGVCAGTGMLACNDGNVCTDDSCDPLKGCVFLPNQAPCSDGNACTSGDVCTGGKCVTTGAVDCNDGNLCTDDACDAVAGCTHKLNKVPCDET